MSSMLNAMHAAAARQSGDRAATRLGTVSSYDPGAYCVKVLLQPEGTETGWLPIKSAWVGNGWGLFAPPSIGDQVEVQFQEDGGEAGLAGGRLYNDEDRPLPVPSGEFWIVHESGSLLKFKNDGTVELASAAAMAVTAPGGLNIVANVVITGTLVNNGKNVGSTHTHGGVETGGGTTGAPT